jgi:hypothetical protein
VVVVVTLKQVANSPDFVIEHGILSVESCF